MGTDSSSFVLHAPCAMSEMQVRDSRGAADSADRENRTFGASASSWRPKIGISEKQLQGLPDCLQATMALESRITRCRSKPLSQSRFS